MNKRTLIVIGCLLGAVAALSQDKGVQFFHGTWQQALAKAKEEKKLIFLDVYTTWCPPCAYLANTVFPQQAMGDYYNQRFINVKINAEEEPGKSIARRYEVSAYPTLLFINDRGYCVEKMLGVKQPDTLLSWPPLVLQKAALPTNEELFDKGERSDSFIAAYCTAFIKEGQPDKAVAVLHQLMREQGAAVLYKPVCFSFMSVVPVDSPAALYLVNHLVPFQQQFGEEAVAALLAEIYTGPSRLSALYQHGPPRIFLPEEHARLLDKIHSRHIPIAAYLEGKINFYRYCRNNNMQQAWATGDSLLQQAKPWQYEDMAVLANKYLKQQYRPRAAKWAEQAALLATDKRTELKCVQVAHDLLFRDYIPVDMATY